MTRIKRILVPTDFSECAEHALEHATTLAERLDADIILAHVVKPMGDHLEAIIRSSHFPNFEEEARKRSERRLRELREARIPSALGSDLVVAMGAPFTEICQLAREREIDLIVIATRGHTGIKHVLLGSTAERVVRLAPCPVLVVRGK